MFHEQQAADMNDRPLGYLEDALEGPPVEVPPLPPNLSAPLSEERKAKIDDLRLQRNSEAAKADQLREQLAAAKDPSPERPVRACSASLSVCAISLT